MRAFIAINLPKEIKDTLYAIQNKLRELGKIKWTNKSQFHITVKFLGNIDDEQLNLTKEILSNIKFKKFQLTIDKLGSFPSITKPKVIWVGVKPEVNVLDLQKKIDGELLDLFTKDEKFEAHITLGRVKIIKNKDILNKLRNISLNGSFKVESFELMESKLTKDGSKYIVLEKYDLA